ncbi:MAG: hypothetical protein B7Y41_09330 [Hydrogenophilales bacterium 28-61-23]|nr:MAG: hypothetical protein B7Y41_09330 [Hydrogenophilales bacterium 28-61-23]
MTHRQPRPLLAALLGLCALAPLSAAALEAVLTDDVHLSSASPASNYGALPTLNVSPSAQALLQFDLGALPAGTLPEQIAKATLHVWVNKVGAAGEIEVAQITSDWGEKTVTQNSAPGIHIPAASVLVAQAGQWASMDLTGTVKQWVEYPASNFGLALAPALSSPATTVFLDSKENTATSHPARLEIVLAGPRGEIGPMGLQGPKGDMGPQGANGAPGATGATGLQGAIGPEGATGPQGATGAQGPSGVVAIAAWNGQATAVTLSNTSYTFVGPTATLTATSSAQRITTAGSLTFVPSATTSLRVDICYRSSTGTTLQTPGVGYKVIPSVVNVRLPVNVANSFKPGAGTWLVGPCVRQNAAAMSLSVSSDDWSTGWAMLTNE